MVVPEWLEPFWHGQLLQEWLKQFWHSINATGRAKMTRAILALKCSNWQCQNGSSHFGTASCINCVPEWPEPFWHGQSLHVYTQNGSSHSGTQLMQLVVPKWLEPFCMALPVTTLECQNGSSHFSPTSCIN